MAIVIYDNSRIRTLGTWTKLGPNLLHRGHIQSPGQNGLDPDHSHRCIPEPQIADAVFWMAFCFESKHPKKNNKEGRKKANEQVDCFLLSCVPYWF